jgi:hypothetical protein
LTDSDELTPRRRLKVIDAQRVQAERLFLQLYEVIAETEDPVDQRLTDLAWWIRVLVREEKRITAELAGEELPQLTLI